jgi:hypothetical protein
MDSLHARLLVELRNLGKYGEEPTHLLTALRPSFRLLAMPGLERALRDLADKSFITAFAGAIGGTRWRITALGESALQEAGL